MLTKESLEHRLRGSYPRLAAKYGLRKMAFFGSYAHGTPGEASDVDLLVEFERPVGLRFMELADELEELLGCKVDLLTETGLRKMRSGTAAAEIMGTLEYV